MRYRSKLRVAMARGARASMTIAGLFALGTLAHAASPAAGIISTGSAPLYWQGTAIGTGAVDGEGVCVDGVNGDTFTLTVTGLPTDWAGKTIKVTLSWTNPINDYDLYIHKDNNNNPAISSSGNGAPDTTEVAGINPSVTGIGVYTIHIVYFTNTPGLDQPLASASVVSNRQAVYLKGGLTFSPNWRNTSPGWCGTNSPGSYRWWGTPGGTKRDPDPAARRASCRAGRGRSPRGRRSSHRSCRSWRSFRAALSPGLDSMAQAGENVPEEGGMLRTWCTTWL